MSEETKKRGWSRGLGWCAGVVGVATMTWLAAGPASVYAQADDSGEAQAASADEEAESDPKKGANAPAEMSAAQVAKRIQKFYSKTEDYQAEFRQVYTDVAAGDSKKSWGRVYFKKPGRMRWDYYKSEKLEDRKKTLVSDGKVFWIYELKFKQVFKKCLSESQLPTSLKFLMGEGNILKDFDVSFTEDSSPDAPALKLVPKEPTSKYKKVHFRVDPETFQVKKTTVFDPYGNTNAIWFGDAMVNKNLPDSGFEFEPPEDARMLNAQKDCE